MNTGKENSPSEVAREKGETWGTREAKQIFHLPLIQFYAFPSFGMSFISREVGVGLDMFWHNKPMNWQD